MPAPGTHSFAFDYTNEAQHTSWLANFSWFLSGSVTDSATLTGVDGGYQTSSRWYVIDSPGDITVGLQVVISGQVYDAGIDNVLFASVHPLRSPNPRVM